MKYIFGIQMITAWDSDIGITTLPGTRERYENEKMEIEWNSLLITLILPILYLAFTALKKILLPKPRVSSLDKKYILITGCDSGFGKSTAVRLDRLGLNVFATCLTKEGKENLERLCSRRLTVIIMDVTDSAQIRNCLQIVQKKIPPNEGLWALINNAGCMTFGPLEWFSLDDYKKMADVNLWGLIDMTKHFLPLIKKAKGRVVNFSSIAGIVSLFNEAPYCITKYGVEAFSDALRREMAFWDVSVVTIVPQGFKTSIWTEVAGNKLSKLWEQIDGDMKKEYGKNYVEEYRNFLNNLMSTKSENLDMVVNAVEDAVTSSSPSHRYVVGLQAKKIALLSLMPSAIQDLWFKAVVGIDGKKVGMFNRTVFHS